MAMKLSDLEQAKHESEGIINTGKKVNLGALADQLGDSIVPIKQEPLNSKMSLEEMTKAMTKKTTESKSGTLLVPNLSNADLKEIKTGVKETTKSTDVIYKEAVEFFKSRGIDNSAIGKVPVGELIRMYVLKKDEMNEANEQPVEKQVKPKPKKHESVKEETTVDEQPEPSLKEIKTGTKAPETKDKKDETVKFQSKPKNAYQRLMANKQKKLLNRQKRGKYVDTFLPNSNITLRIYELRQIDCLTTIVGEARLSTPALTRLKVLQTILDRSSVLCANSDEIETSELLNFISHDDIGFIYVAAALVNTQAKVPFRVQCGDCGREAIVDLDIEKVFNKIQNDIPAETKALCKISDSFDNQIRKSNAGMEAVIYDDDARVRLNIKVPSLSVHTSLSEYIKNHIVSKYENLLSRDMLDRSSDEQYRYIFTNHAQSNTDLIKDISDALFTFYVDKIAMYDFDAPEDEWKDDKHIMLEYDEDSTSEEVFEAVGTLELSTVQKLDEALIELKSYAKIPSTGNWRCECGAINDTPIMGLDLLMNSLQIKMQMR